MLTLPKVHSLHVAIHPAHSTLVCLVLHCDCGQPGTQAPLYCSLLGTELTVIAAAFMAREWEVVVVVRHSNIHISSTDYK